MTKEEMQTALEELKKLRSLHKVKKLPSRTTGERVSDWLAERVGSWGFIIGQGILLGLWIIANVTAYIKQWDPYPFILLNLVLSFQAAFTAPIIMMSQNRQNVVDRQHAENDYNINIKAELEIELLHQKLDNLKEQEIKELIGIIKELAQRVGSV